MIITEDMDLITPPSQGSGLEGDALTILGLILLVQEVITEEDMLILLKTTFLIIMRMHSESIIG